MPPPSTLAAAAAAHPYVVQQTPNFFYSNNLPQPRFSNSSGGGTANSTGGGGGGNNNYNNTGASWSVDILIPGLTDGPRAAEFQQALRTSAALSSHEGMTPEPPSHVLTHIRRCCTMEGAVPEMPLQHLRGHFVALSRDQIGSRVVQSALESANEEEILEIFEELREKLYILMADQFGNYVVQRLFDTRVEEVVGALGEALVGHVLPFSLHVYGCRVVQKAFEELPMEARIELSAELQPYTLHCMGDHNANHVIQKCLEKIQPSEPVREMIESIAGNAMNLARHSFGCRSVQRLLQSCTIEDIHAEVTAEVLGTVLELTKNQFGNYVVQHLVANGPEDARWVVVYVSFSFVSFYQFGKDGKERFFLSFFFFFFYHPLLTLVGWLMNLINSITGNVPFSQFSSIHLGLHLIIKCRPEFLF